MAEKEFDQLTPEEKKARFQKALDDYNSGFVEVDYTLRSVASIRVEEALEDAGRGLEEFKPAQRRVLLKLQKQTEYGTLHEPEVFCIPYEVHYGAGNGRKRCHMASYWEDPSQKHCGQATYQRPDKKDKGKDAEGRA